MTCLQRISYTWYKNVENKCCFLNLVAENNGSNFVNFYAHKFNVDVVGHFDHFAKPAFCASN